MLKNIFYFLILFDSFTFSKTYYEKFEEALQLYKDGRFRLSEQIFKNILIKEKDFKDPVSHLFVAKSQIHQGLWAMLGTLVKPS